MAATIFPALNELANELRLQLEKKKFVLLYAYNGTGKTRLSVAFKDIGKQGELRDTLYFNAFTEDLFSWDNDLDGDNERYLMLHPSTKFFSGVEALEMDTRIRPLLQRYADFDFKLEKLIEKDDDGKAIGERMIVRFSRNMTSETTQKIIDNIKVSRGEENIFIWCFFLAIVQLAIDDDGTGPYKWVRYIYIDDPISSLDENNAIAVANHLAQLLSKTENSPKCVISTHHTLFFNVISNELKKKAFRHLLGKGAAAGSYFLQDTTSKPFLHHLATLVELGELVSSGGLYTHHFNMLRRVMEQTANFLGLEEWHDCIKVYGDDDEKTFHKRIIDLMSHGDYSLYEPREMMDENKKHFREIFENFIASYPFNQMLFSDEKK